MFLLALFEASENPLIGFIGFALMLAGFFFLGVGLVIYITNKREWNLYFSELERTDLPKVQKRINDKKKSIIYIIIGVVAIVASFFIN